MIARARSGGGFALKALVAALGIWVFSGSLATSHAGDVEEAGPPPGPDGFGFGTLGWAPPGYYPGVYGFLLRFHPGYGYGGESLGVGAFGGYPLYGGPGYIHPAPPLNRFGHILPFTYYAGPGYPFNFRDPGELVVDQPVVVQMSGPDPGHSGGPVYDYNVGYGPFTGMRPYPESYFAPYTAAASGSSVGPNPFYPSLTATNISGVRNLGIDEEPVVEADGARAIKVASVHPGSPAQQAGLQVGDVIHSVNGYLTQQAGNLAWIIANQAPKKLLTINVRKASDGKEHTVTAQLP
jgi:membrane-associated protease RseP (regulator of RpoE activity)